MSRGHEIGPNLASGFPRTRTKAEGNILNDWIDDAPTPSCIRWRRRRYDEVCHSQGIGQLEGAGPKVLDKGVGNSLAQT